MASLNPKTGVLGHRLAAHLLRRCTYVASKQNIENFSTMTVSDAVDELLTIKPLLLDEPIDPATGMNWIFQEIDTSSQDGQLTQYVKGWWMNEAMHDLSLSHKMEFFLHTNFSTHYNELTSRQFFDHLSYLRYYSLGNFRLLAEKITTDNLMLRYLDNTQNNKNNPNENYAREFLELFTIGKGPQIGDGDYTNYTELDVQQAARVLTGFKTASLEVPEIDPDTGIRRGRTVPFQHDLGDKVFSYAFNFATITVKTDEQGELDMWAELADFVQMIFDQDETARHICRKLYRYFVSRHIDDEIEQDIIEPLATTFRDNDYNLSMTLELLLKSQHFYDEDDSSNTDEIIGAMIKSPLDLVASLIKQTDVYIPDVQTETFNHYDIFYRRLIFLNLFQNAGFDMFGPPSVASYPAYHQAPTYDQLWFNSSTILNRYQFPTVVLELPINISGDGHLLNVVTFVENHISNPYAASTIVEELLNLLFPEYPDASRIDYFLNVIFLQDTLEPEDWTYEWDNYVLTEDDTEVRIGLESLFEALLYAQEFQLM